MSEHLHNFDPTVTEAIFVDLYHLKTEFLLFGWTINLEPSLFLSTLWYRHVFNRLSFSSILLNQRCRCLKTTLIAESSCFLIVC